jgi:hypothetical protein
MLFHDALHLVFTTFSRQVLQQGRLTAYLADCGVFDTFDDRRTICLTIDCHYGDRLFACLSHKPYKATFDTIVQECKQRHPNIDPVIVDYVFQSIRFAWGKIKSVRPPKPPVLFPPVKKKRSSRLSPLASSPKKRPSPKRRPSLQGGAGGRLTPNTIHHIPKNHHAYQKRTARVVLYILAIIFAFAAIITYNGGEMLMGTIFFGAMATCLLIIHKLL